MTSTEMRDRAPLSREALHAISAEFLASKELAAAPLSEKKEFLKTKGLSEDEIDSLLTKASKAARKAAKESKESASSSSTSSSSLVQTSSEDDSRESFPQDLKEIKPVTMAQPLAPQPLIVTYPEFLAPPPAPPAPVSGVSLVKAMYVAGGIGATIYGANKYLFQPMYDSLTQARSELAQTALNNLTEFNSKLSLLVPPSRRPAIPHMAYHDNGYDSDNEAGKEVYHDSDSDDDGSETSSHPSSVRTHLFHVDASTQTTDPTDPLSENPDSPETKLATLTTHMATLVEHNSDGADSELQFELESLTTYLDSLRYDSNSMFGLPFGTFTGSLGDKAKDDPLAKLKAEIRSVKGVLLNSKNFPASR